MKSARSLPVLLLCLFVTCLTAGAQNTDVASTMEMAADIRESDYDGALELYEKVVSAEPSNFEARWNAGFLHTKIGHRAKNDEDKKRHYDIAMEIAKWSLEVKPNEANSHYLMAVAMGRITEITGAKERVKSTPDIRKYFEAAVAIDPSHAGAWHGLGRWHYRLANLTLAERAAAAVLWGRLPSDASNEQAIECFNKAVQSRSDYILYRLDLGIAYIKTNQEDLARRTLNAAVSMSAQTEDDPDYIEQAKALLAKI